MFNVLSLELWFCTLCSDMLIPAPIHALSPLDHFPLAQKRAPLLLYTETPDQPQSGGCSYGAQALRSALPRKRSPFLLGRPAVPPLRYPLWATPSFRTSRNCLGITSRSAYCPMQGTSRSLVDSTDALSRRYPRKRAMCTC